MILTNQEKRKILTQIFSDPQTPAEETYSEIFASDPYFYDNDEVDTAHREWLFFNSGWKNALQQITTKSSTHTGFHIGATLALKDERFVPVTKIAELLKESA